MDRGGWETKLACFQAYSRAYLVRNEVRRVRDDFEDIVKEIDGGLTHVEWKETVIPIPHFTDTDGPFLPPSSSDSRPSNAPRHVCARPLNPSSSSSSSSSTPSAPSAASASTPSASSAASASASSSSAAPSASSSSSVERGDHRVLPEKIEAERDDSQTLSKRCIHNSNITAAGVSQKESREVENDGDSTTAWSSLELDVTYGHSHKAPQQFCLAQKVPCTPEALRLHRNTLTMELVWLQQAIDSRKKYLSLKDRLSVS